MSRIDTPDTTQALKLLMQEHRRIRRLLEHAAAVDGDPLAQARAADLACRELDAHADLEERLLYPALRSLGTGDVTGRAEHDHAVARQLVAVLDAMGPADGQYDATLRELAAWVDEHVKLEEETLLARASEAGLDLAALAVALLERQRQGAVTDVDVDAEVAMDAGSDVRHAGEANGRQRAREPGRRGAH
jgi:hypothetical protein